MMQTSFSFFNSNNGIRKRMEEMSKYYSGNNSNKNSGPVIVSYKNDIFSKDNNKNINNVDKNLFFKENKNLKLELSKEITPRCLIAQRYNEKSNL